MATGSVMRKIKYVDIPIASVEVDSGTSGNYYTSIDLDLPSGAMPIGFALDANWDEKLNYYINWRNGTLCLVCRSTNPYTIPSNRMPVRIYYA